MANLIDKKYFNYDINLPDSEFSDVGNYITRYEKEILTRLLGYELYSEVSTSTETSGHIFANSTLLQDQSTCHAQSSFRKRV